MDSCRPYTRDMTRLPTWGRAGELALKPRLGAVFRDVGYEAMRAHADVSDLLRDLADSDLVPWTADAALQPTHRASSIKQLPAELKRELDLLIKPVLEQWVGFKLTAPAAATPGAGQLLRRYTAGGTLPAQINQSSPASEPTRTLN